MSQNPFRLHGKTPPACLGRHDVLARIADAFDADDPANVAVFGPKYVGKSVLLREVAARYARPESGASNEDSPFDGVVYWDLRHAGITDQESFYEAFARTLAPALDLFNKEAANLLKNKGAWDTIRLVADDLAEKEQRVLVVMDNFDALMKARIPQGAWENIRNLYADIGSVYYLVGSRRSLTDLCGVDQEGYDLSDFPRIFDLNVELGAFTKDDGEAMRQAFAEKQITFAKGSDSEVDRWTGGVPPLTALVYGRLWEAPPSNGTVEHTDVQEAVNALRTSPDLALTLQALWKDCESNAPQGTQQALAVLAQPDTPDVLEKGKGVSGMVASALLTRGYVAEKGNRIASSCALMNEYAREHGEAATAIHQLFGTQEGFNTHMPRVLALRLSRVDAERLERAKSGLFRKAEHIIEHADEPDVMLAQVRSFTNQAIDACIKALCPGGQIPMNWTARWKSRGVKAAQEGKMEGTAPGDVPGQLRLLREATYSDHGLKDVPLSRASYILASYLHDVGNEGQHLTSDLWPAFAHSICLAVISLCDQLAAELERVQPGA